MILFSRRYWILSGNSFHYHRCYWQGVDRDQKCWQIFLITYGILSLIPQKNYLAPNVNGDTVEKPNLNRTKEFLYFFLCFISPLLPFFFLFLFFYIAKLVLNSWESPCLSLPSSRGNGHVLLWGPGFLFLNNHISKELVSLWSVVEFGSSEIRRAM
jgi:hypothetical protein